MIAIAIFSVDPELRRDLEQLPRSDPAVTVVGVVDSTQELLELVEKRHIDVVLANEAPARSKFADWQVRHYQIGWVVLLDHVDEQSSLETLAAGASAILPRSADQTEIIAAIRAVANGLAVVQRQLLPALLNKDAPLLEQSKRGDDGHFGLTKLKY